MQAIELTYESHNGMVPEQDWLKKNNRVIVQEYKMTPVSPIKANTWLGCMSDRGQILGDIVSTMDDNLSIWDVLAE
ncbi:MAG: hypothetical protein DRR16_12210 [Candidatus Parabeggiatoa sp. nov. 3]|jgi:hypothetical protein|nr:MAG: hypothetical protein DRR00_04680 [Gammaproteobacteria bacterium]RKZ63151.1 MAG: hypothetical protein DRQ99_17585 [Gammaproteobacteria bacterium]RKZ85352.1 MAG: hypothetical protein DRR16_12210 [Gammaproteobacteria bacterium]HEW97255.1 hypothetical protein [Beggiatoa sp.]